MQKIKLGDVLDVKRGASLSGDYYAEEGEYVRLTLGNFNYPGGGFKENTSKSDIYFVGPIKPEFILNEGDIITPLTEQVSGLLGETATIPEGGKYIQSGDVGLVIPDETKLDKRFAYYLISSPIVRKQLDAAAQQTKIRHTSPDAIKACEAWIPEEISVQASIGRLLDSINEKIANNNAICSNLEAMAKLLYDYWFVQFDFPDENGKPYKSSGGKMAWNDELKREIPAGWEVKPLPNICDLRYGFPLSTEFFGVNGKSVIRIRDIADNTVSAKTTEVVGTEYLTRAGDLLVGMDGNFQMNYWTRDNEIVNQRITRIRQVSLPLMVIKMQIEPYIAAKVSSVARSTVGHLGDADFKKQPILCPDNMNYSFFENALNTIVELRNENQQLASLRDFLLPMLMNGQVKVII